jgi:DNA ligase-1
MGTPSKRRKFNDSSKNSPAAAPRNLDFFFGKQKQHPSAKPSSIGEQPVEHEHDESDLTDEQLARKLQAEWDQEDSGQNGRDQPSATPAGEASHIPPVEERKLIHNQELKTGNVGNISTEEKNGILEASLKNSATPDPERQPEADSAITAAFPPEPNGRNTLSLQSAGSAEDTITFSIPFDESLLVFEPSKYVADLQSHWATEGGNASYSLLTRCFVLVNSTQSRIKIVDTLVNLLRVIIEGDPSSLLPTVRTIYCCSRGRVVLVTCYLFISYLILPSFYVTFIFQN